MKISLHLPPFNKVEVFTNAGKAEQRTGEQFIIFSSFVVILPRRKAERAGRPTGQTDRPVDVQSRNRVPGTASPLAFSSSGLDLGRLGGSGFGDLRLGRLSHALLLHLLLLLSLFRLLLLLRCSYRLLSAREEEKDEEEQEGVEEKVEKGEKGKKKKKKCRRKYDCYLHSSHYNTRQVDMSKDWYMK